MSGIAAAQIKRNADIRRSRQERSFPLGGHRVVNYGWDQLVCIDCDTQVKDDPHGRDILRESDCTY